MFICFPVKAQLPEFYFQNLTLENGLSSNRVTSIIQDKKGFLWIGTEEGLNRYDGYRFKSYYKKRGDNNSLSHNYIWSLCEDKNGYIWIATNGGGLNKFDPVTEKFIQYKFDSLNTSSLSSDIVQCVYIDKQNNLWVGTWSEGLNLYDPASDSFNRFKHNPEDEKSISSDKIWCVYEDSKDNLWVGTEKGGLNLFDRSNNNFTHYLPDKNPGTSISGTSAVTLLEDSKGNLWIGTYGDGIDRFNNENKIFTNFKADLSPGSLTGNFIWKIFEDNQGLIWIATQSNGICYYDYELNKFFPVALSPQNPTDVSSNNGRTIYEDNTSNLWIGTIVGGVFKTDRKQKKFSTIKTTAGKQNSLPEDFIFTMCEDKAGDIWIGTYSYLCKLFPDGRIKTYSTAGKASVEGEIIRYIFEDSKFNLWVGTYFGKLNKYDRETDSFIKYDLDFEKDNPGANNIRTIFEDSEGNLWFGSNGDGLKKFNAGTNTFEVLNTKNSNISGDGILSITEDSDGFLWIGTFSKGLNKFDKKKKSFQHFFPNDDDTTSLGDISVPELFVDSKGVLWVGTFSGGLSRYDSQKNIFETYTEENGLAGNFVCGILEDDNYNLWISTSKGISKFSLTAKTFKNYDFNDGLQKGEFNPAAKLKTKNGMFYFGGLNGINYFHPDSLSTNSSLVPVTLTSFKVHNNEKIFSENISYADTLRLNYDEDNFSFEFASLDYTLPERNKYAYKLEGLDKNWNYVDNRRFANYTHLDPGEYIFRVKATNHAGSWNEAGVSVLLIIKPPFWATFWFRGILIFGLIGIVGFIYRLRISNLEKEKKSQEEFSKRLIQSQEEERKRIASELHDSIGQNLLLIKNYASLGKKSKELETGIKHFEDISDNTASAIDEVRRIAYNLHPYHLERLGLTNAILSILDNAEISSQINFDIKADNIDNILLKETEINLFRIIQECINNIIKHSRAEKAEITIEKKEFEIVIKIKDNGIGFSQSGEISAQDYAKGFGLENLKKRINLIKGEIKINSESGKGTEVMIKLPI